MRKERLHYKKGYKYQLVKDFQIQTNIVLGKDAIPVNTQFITLHIDGTLIVRKFYSYDGPSGLTIDTKNFMRGSLVHDCFYQLFRESKLSLGFREQADKELKRICLEDGMSKIRAWYVYRAVRRFAKFAALPKNKKEVLKAP